MRIVFRKFRAKIVFEVKFETMEYKCWSFGG